MLKGHNERAVKCITESLKVMNRACAIQPTGTGKSFIALGCIGHYKKSKILYTTSYKSNMEEFKAKVEHYYPKANVDYRIYSTVDATNQGHYDIIIVDELHRLGARSWYDVV